MNTEVYTEQEKISREELVNLLNEDLAREYQAIIAYTVYSQVLKVAAYTDIARGAGATCRRGTRTCAQDIATDRFLWRHAGRCPRNRGAGD